HNNGDFITKGPWVDARAYNSAAFNDTTISAAITAIGSAKKTLLLAPGTWTISNSVTVPSNINLRFEQGAVLSVGATYTFTINGPIDAPLVQIFSGSGTVSLSHSYKGKVYPHWWGADPTGATLSNSAFTAAFGATGPLILYLAEGTFKLENWTCPDGARIYGEDGTIQGDGDLIVNAGWIHFEKITFKNLTTAGKLITYQTGSIGGGEIIDCTFGKANYHIYKASGVLVGTRYVGCKFGTNSGNAAAIYSRYYGDLNEYSEIGCYTTSNEKGLYAGAGSSVLIMDSVLEYQNSHDITISVPTGKAMYAFKMQNVHLEALTTKTLAYVKLEAVSGSGIYTTFDNVYATPIATEAILGSMPSGSFSAWVRINKSVGLGITPNLPYYWKVSRDNDDTTQGIFTVTPTNLTVVGGTGVTFTNKYTEIGNVVTFSVVIHPNGGTTKSTNGSTYLTTSSGGLPASTTWSSSVNGSRNADHSYTTGNGATNGTLIYLPAWNASSSDISISGSYIADWQ
ncbi:hypothetical protein HY605_04565, partial [Candidatus Peregrinibacteria bacterium]|nr:hypothetical protein [Candidatus Peregrinibacteria bacterium]